MTSTAKIAFDWKHFTDEDKLRLADSVRECAELAAYPSGIRKRKYVFVSQCLATWDAARLEERAAVAAGGAAMIPARRLRRETAR